MLKLEVSLKFRQVLGSDWSSLQALSERISKLLGRSVGSFLDQVLQDSRLFAKMSPGNGKTVIGKKRKREHTSTSSKSPKGETNDVLEEEILLLENSILESRKHYNNIVNLLEYARSYDEIHQIHLVASVALCRVFTRLMIGGNLTLRKELSEGDKTVVRWLDERLSEFKDVLSKTHLFNEDFATRNTALTLLMRLSKEEAKAHGSESAFDEQLRGLITASFFEKYDADLMAQFIEQYVIPYCDIRMQAVLAVTEKCRDQCSAAQVENALNFLLSVPSISSEEEELPLFLDSSTRVKKAPKLFSHNKQIRQAQSAWLAILKQKVGKPQQKRILDAFTSHVAPSFVDVALLMDFLTDSFNTGGSTSLAALSGIFYLIQHKGLDYPQFFQKLYSMLDQNLLHSKHRSRFLRLLNTCLASTHLPAALVASFIKRLARLSLNAPPAGIVVVVPLIYNLLQSHQQCRFLVHRVVPVEGHDQRMGDPYDMAQPNPMTTNAIDSSLWEIETLQNHYHPNVAAIAKILFQPFTKPAYNLEDFLDHSYATVCPSSAQGHVRIKTLTEMADDRQ